MTDGIESCDCPMIGEGDHSNGICGAEGPNGCLCSRPEDHGGKHMACAPNAHPLEEWGND